MCVLYGDLSRREARVAVDPERRSLRIGDQRDAARLEPLGERDHQQLHRLLDQALVVGLARLEPRPVVVGGEIRHELDAVGGEPGEGRRDRHLAPPAAPGVYAGTRDRPVPGPSRVRSCRDEPRPRRAMDGYPVPPPTMTDLYELTMAAGYWKLGRLDDRGDLHAVLPPRAVRRRVHAGGRPRGRDRVHRALRASRPPELAHLAGLVGNDDKPLFEPAFLDYLARPAAARSTSTRCPRARSRSRTSRCCGSRVPCSRRSCSRARCSTS